MVQISVAVALLLLTLALRGAGGNRHIRSRLLISCWLFAAYGAAAALSQYAPLSPGMVRQIEIGYPLLLAFGVINLIVVLLINPWQADRLPDRFPSIVQDAIIIALFALVATLLLQERILAMTAVSAVILGFALQETLSNLFAGLAIQIEKPFRVGHWVTIGGQNGLVSEITWRATKVRTKAGNFVIVPNSVLARDTITNYSEPTLETRVEVDIGAGYETPPNEVKAAIRAAIRDEPLITASRAPEIILLDFGASAVVYRVRVWTTDFAADETIQDRMRSQIYYAFRRRGINIPYPIQVQIEQEPVSTTQTGDRSARILDAVEIFASLNEEQRLELAEACRLVLYAAGDAVVREGDAGSSMFVMSSGEAIVTLVEADGEVARIQKGGFFGEMSLLTGEPRTATVTAATDCELLEIQADSFRRVVLPDPALVEKIASAVAARRADLERHRTTRRKGPESSETPHTFLARVRRFLRLSAPR